MKFIYPYNFVPCKDETKRDKFKPIHLYNGLSGRIEYRLKTLTPLFIPDPEGTTVYQLATEDEKKKIHKVMDFFNVNGRLCLPPTSIKGMVRNVVEAATNSSFGVLSSYPYPTVRKPPDQAEPLIVTKEGKESGSGWEFSNAASFKVSKEWCGKHERESNFIPYCAEVEFKASGGKVVYIKYKGNEKGDKTKGDIEGTGLLYRPVEPMEGDKPQHWFQVICHFDRENNTADLDFPEDSKRTDISNRMIKQYMEAYPEEKLKKDSIVFFMKRFHFSNEATCDKPTIGRVLAHKMAEECSVEDLIKHSTRSALYPKTTEKLCPATRLFGWVPEREGSEQGIAGRVRFKTVWSDKKLESTILIPLKILSGPKPKYYPFYLKPKDKNIDPNEKAAYYTKSEKDWAKIPGTIRGRKFYLHHPAAMKDDWQKHISYKHEHLSEEGKKEPTRPHINQNSTCAVLPPDAEFKGTIEFESLDEYELGMLLWCLTLSDNPREASRNHAHKLGMGKGIGLGSVQFNIESVVIERPEKNWFDIESTDEQLDYIDSETITSSDLQEYVRKFKTWLVTGSPEGEDISNAFKELPFIKDLLLILEKNLADDTPVQYYPPGTYADKGFNYFMEQRGKRLQNKEEPLKTPSAIKNGNYQEG